MHLAHTRFYRLEKNKTSVVLVKGGVVTQPCGVALRLGAGDEECTNS